MKKIILLALITIALTAWIGYRTDIDVGRVVNNEGDGKLYNGEAFYNYIAYPAYYEENDIILTICFLNPFNNYCDDIVTRMDIRLFEDIKPLS